MSRPAPADRPTAARITRCAALALVLSACATTLDIEDGEGNRDGEGGLDGDSPSGATGGADDARPRYVGCPEAEGVPAAELVHQTPWGITALLAHDEAIVYATEELADFSAQLVRLDPVTKEIVEEDDVPATITSLRRVGDRVYGGGYCIDGGSPYVIGDGPTITALASGCGGNPSSSLAFVAGGIAFERDSSVRWVPDGSRATEEVASFSEAKEGEMPPNVTGVATDGTDVFASLTYTQLGANDSWGEIWRLPIGGGEPVRLAQTAFGTSFDDGGIAGLVVDGDHVYFLDHLGGDLLRVPKAGGAVEPFWSGDRHVRDLVDTGTHFAFLEFGDLQECATVVRAVAKSGGDAARIATLPHFAGGVFVDGARLYSLGAVAVGTDFEAGIFRTSPLP
jgi:hypothetical protein